MYKPSGQLDVRLVQVRYMSDLCTVVMPLADPKDEKGGDGPLYPLSP